MGWGTGNLGGGSGGGLNFKVVAYSTESNLLSATPKENTIGVITTNEITSWTFSATAPNSPVDGVVWFSTGTSSGVEFNALKKNGIQVYPISAKQYVSGAWVDKTAKSYKNGAWTDWAVEFYFVKSGEKKAKQTYISATQNSTLSSENGLLTIKPSGDSYRGLYFKGKKDGHTTLSIDGVFTGNATTIKVWNVNAAPTYQNYNTTALASAAVNTTGGNLDISNLSNGEYLFGFCSGPSETNKIRNFLLK